MDTPTLQARINELRSQINPYSQGKKFSDTFSFDSFTASNKTYIGIPIVILVLLIVFRPSFIQDEYVDKKGVIGLKLSFKKLIQYWLILSVVLLVAVAVYNYKKS